MSSITTSGARRGLFGAAIRGHACWRAVAARGLAAIVLAVVPSIAQAQLPTKDEVVLVANSLAADFLATNNAPSIAIGIVRGTDTFVAQAWGEANVSPSRPATAHTVFRIGSVTKQFTAAAILQLAERKQISLTDPIERFLPDLPLAWRSVTVTQLLNHTSGIPSYTELGSAWSQRWPEAMKPETIVNLTTSQPMKFAPGTDWSYSNSGYVLLGIIIERLTGRAWGVDLTERFFKPLGMTETRVCPDVAVGVDAAGYQRGRATWELAPFLSLTQPYAAGALCSTVGDLAKWNRALHAGQVLNPASYASMVTPTGAAERMQYGFGLLRDSIGGVLSITHGGGINGFVAFNAWVPSTATSVTLLANAPAPRLEDLGRMIIAATHGVAVTEQPPAKPLASVPLSHADRQKFVGVYTLDLPGGTRELTFTERGDDLTSQLGAQPTTRLVYLGNNTFAAGNDPSIRYTFTIDGDVAASVTVAQGSRRFEGKRRR